MNDVRFYSHAADGSLRLAIYHDDGLGGTILRWQSNPIVNTTLNGLEAIPISNGTPSTLDLPSGNYWLAWQTDSTEDVASYTDAQQDQGFRFDQPFGPSPAFIAPHQLKQKSRRWTQYITYDADLLPPAILGDATPTSALDHNSDGLLDAADLVFQ